MEIALLCAHLCLIPPNIYDSNQVKNNIMNMNIYQTLQNIFIFLKNVHSVQSADIRFLFTSCSK